MPIAKVAEDRLNEVMALVFRAVEDMRSRGIDQWDAVYPNREDFRLDIESGCLFGCFGDGGALKGVLCLNERQAEEYGSIRWRFPSRHALVVHRLCVDPVFKRQGTAGVLMAFAAGYARENGYEVIRLDAFPPNAPAIALYESRGYLLAGKVAFRKGIFHCYELKL